MHLEEIALHVAPGAHAVLLLDQAGWHASAELVIPSNITLVPLPPRCPELNPGASCPSDCANGHMGHDLRALVLLRNSACKNAGSARKNAICMHSADAPIQWKPKRP